MRRIRMMAIVGAMMALAAACVSGPPLDQGLSNTPPYPQFGYDEKSPRLLEIAVLVDRAGAPTTQDRPVMLAMIDRAIRYAARLADARKAAQFDILFTGQDITRTLYSGADPVSANRRLRLRGAVGLRDEGAPPPAEGKRFVTRDVLATQPDRPLFAPITQLSP